MRNEGAYAYAKACGIISKSFIGKRISSLAGLNSLSELDRLVFSDTRRELPGKELLADLEKRFVQRAVRQILVIVNSWHRPPELLVRMLKAYELSDLKVCFQYISSGKDKLPNISDIGHFRTVNFQAFPDIAAMLAGSDYKYILPDVKSLQKDNPDFTQIETKLDWHHYLSIAECMSALSSGDREIIQKLVIDEISLRNCIWALRLRTYYHKTEKETEKYLMNIRIKEYSQGGTVLLSRHAKESLDFPLDSRKPWEGWKWEKFLNPEEPAKHWDANPRYFQNAASGYLYRLAKKYFHRCPVSVSAIFCFIKLKQFEEDLLTSVAEGFSLGMDSVTVFKMLEIPA